MDSDGGGAPGRASKESELFGGARERPVYRALLTDRNYRRLLIATFTSSLGDWIGVLAILSLTESILRAEPGAISRAVPFALSGVMVARLLPSLLLGPVAGVYADRWDRKRTMIAADLGRGVVMLLIAFSGDFIQLFVATFLIEVFALFFTPAKDATIPNLVPHRRLVHANQLSLMVTYGTLPLGGVLFALLVTASQALFSDVEFLRERPEAVAIWLNALTFFFAAVVISGISMPRRRAQPVTPLVGTPGHAGAWRALRDGLLFIARTREVRSLVGGVMAAAFAAGVLLSLGPLFVKVANADETGWGMLVAVSGTGMFAGLAFAAPLARRIGTVRVFAPGIAFGGLAAIGAALMPRVDLAAIGGFFMGVGAGAAFVTGYTLLQARAGDEVRGRTFAAFNTGVRLALFSSLVVAPLLAGLIGPEPARSGQFHVGGVRLTMVFGGLVAVIGGLWTWVQDHRSGRASSGLTLRADAAGGGRVRTDHRGLFVAFEGGEGAGKSTQLRLLRAAVERAGHDVVTTREPGGTIVGERLREALLDPASTVSDRTEALLYAAARAQLADELIRPALEKGAVVLCDRFVDSSIAYQGAGRALGERDVEELNRWGTCGLRPDLVVLLDIDPAVGLRRLDARTRDRLEAEDLAFHRRANEALRRRAAGDPDRYLVVDARLPVETIHALVRDTVLARLERGGG